MRIKHFTGYGTVNATKTSTRKIFSPYMEKPLTEIKIRVRGNHERGIAFKDWDVYGAASWLLTKHFMKGFDPNNAVQFCTESKYEKLPNGVDEEVCDYTFIVR